MRPWENPAPRPPGRALRTAVQLCGWLLLFGVVRGGAPVWAEPPLTIYYFSRPPFYTTDASGEAGGVLVDRTRAIMVQAGIDHRFVPVPSKRVLLLLRQGGTCCGVGWLRTPERATLARFSRPIHRDAALVALVRPALAPLLAPGPSLAWLLNSSLVLGAIDGFSYGEAVDLMIAQAQPRRQLVTGEVSRLMRMVAAGRCDWMLINPLEARWQMENDPDLGRGLRLLALPDAPVGNPRHLMCSQDVTPEIMERIDQAIVRMLGESFPETLPPGQVRATSQETP